MERVITHLKQEVAATERVIARLETDIAHTAQREAELWGQVIKQKLYLSELKDALTALDLNA